MRSKNVLPRVFPQLKVTTRLFSLFIAFVLFFIFVVVYSGNAAAVDNCQYFPETGYQVCNRFLQYWNANGGLAQQGYPISNVFEELNAAPPAGDGNIHRVQYFQRGRFEEHLDNQAPYDVLLGLLGSEQYKTRYGIALPSGTSSTMSGTCQTFKETGYSACGIFLTYWKNNGGLMQQGYPISNVFEEQNALPPAGDGKVHRVQYFQRARFEEHLEAQTPYVVQLGLLGAEQYKAKYQTAVVTPTPTATTYKTSTPVQTSTPKPTITPAGIPGVVYDVRNGSISADKIEQVFAQYPGRQLDAQGNYTGVTIPNPLTGKAAFFLQMGQKYSLNPAYALAWGITESGLGTAGLAVTTYNIYNITYNKYSTCPGSITKVGSDGISRTFCTYNTLEDGVEAWFNRIRTMYVDGGLGRGNLITVDQIVPVYAPAADNNDVNLYINQIKTRINLWGAY